MSHYYPAGMLASCHDTQPNPKGSDMNVGTRVIAPRKGYTGIVTQVLGNPKYVVVSFDRWNGQHIGSQTCAVKMLEVQS